ncbi:LacI family DNA-binding transcriptional regulator [Paenibacillus sp. YIM B09110]|uniref:LacI family DNA-binding transcriptional regulator n=1 Tax=Paenibacillus sp. YIM B09110 TaxID=3126102 RepID=UPI00301CCC2D
MKVTIRQIAEKAGVSRGTVDRVLNGRYGVKPDVRDRVLSIVEEMNYVPNLAGKALAYQKKPAVVGIVMPPEHIRFFDQIREGISLAAAELKDMGLRLEFQYVDSTQPEKCAQAVRELVNSGVQGILYASLDDSQVRAMIDEAVDRGIPVVTFNSDVEDCKRACFVGQDLYKSGSIAAGLMKRILPRGAQIAVVLGNPKFQAHRVRTLGFTDAMKAWGNPLEIASVIEIADRYEDTFTHVDETLKTLPDLEGIYLATGDIAACIDALRLNGKAGQIRIVCNDLLPEIEQGLKDNIIDFTIVQNPEQQGYRSLRVLYDLMFSGKQPDAELIYTATSIYIPESL